MKQVVIVAPHFPPSNLTAGHRCRYFAMHLPKFGWKVKVLSVNPGYYEEKLDYELEALLPPELGIIRTRAFGVRPWRFIGDIGIRAFWWHYRALCRLVQNEKVDLICISIPPNYSALLGHLIYRRFRIPYVIDYQDPWVHVFSGCERLFSKAWFSYQLSRILEPWALRHVSFLTGIAPGYYEGALNRCRWIDPSRCLSIPLGAEETEFQYLDTHPRQPYLFQPSNGNFHIVYAGAMLPRAYSTLEALFQALIIIKKDWPSIFQRLRFHFIGTGSKLKDPRSFTIRPLAERYNLSNVICEFPARIPYLDVLNHLKHANAILILGSSEPHYTPSKIFQAALSRRPIIALLHTKSTAVGILEEANMGITITFDEDKTVDRCIDDIAQAIYKIIQHNYSQEEVNWKKFFAYSAEAMTQKLAQSFDFVVSN